MIMDVHLSAQSQLAIALSVFARWRRQAIEANVIDGVLRGCLIAVFRFIPMTIRFDCH